MSQKQIVTANQVAEIANWMHRHRDEIQEKTHYEASAHVADQTGITFGDTTFRAIAKELGLTFKRNTRGSPISRGLKMFREQQK